MDRIDQFKERVEAKLKDLEKRPTEKVIVEKHIEVAPAANADQEQKSKKKEKKKMIMQEFDNIGQMDDN